MFPGLEVDALRYVTAAEKTEVAPGQSSFTARLAAPRYIIKSGFLEFFFSLDLDFANRAISTSAMSKQVDAPQQFKQPSRKGKKAWRKNVDVTEVQEGLRQLKEEEIKGYVTFLRVSLRYLLTG